MFVFVRHGETVYNKEHRFQGRSDSPLTEHGIKQAKAVGAEISKYNPSLFFISPLPRVFETYSYMQPEKKVPYEIVSELAETCYGEWEEKGKSEIAKNPLWIKRQQDRFNFVHPGRWHDIPGESYRQLYERLIPFFIRLENLDDTCTVIIAHIGVMLAAKKYYEGHSDTEAGLTRLSNSSICIVQKDDNNWKLTQKEILW